jgi:type I protein arginine methyltransferase
MLKTRSKVTSFGSEKSSRQRGGRRAPSFLQRQMRSALRGVRDFIKSNRTLGNLLYDDRNMHSFTKLEAQEYMLGDSSRIDAYHKAIVRNVHEGDLVLDLGTGSGILAFFAAQQKAKRVYAIDHSPIIDVARKVASHNGLTNIEFAQINSREFLTAEKLDVIVHEQLGDEVINENLVENLLDLRGRLLKPGGRILPSKFELYLEPVTLKEGYSRPYIWEKALHGVDFGFLHGDESIEPFKDQTYSYSRIKGALVEALKCEPSPILRIDLDLIDSSEEFAASIRRPITKTGVVVNSGELHGFLTFMRILFDDETTLDTSPKSKPTHWLNSLYRTPHRQYQVDDEITYTLEITDIFNASLWSVALDGLGASE